MGTPGFAVPALEALVAAGLPPALVVTAPDGTAGRGKALRPSAVKLAAEARGLAVRQPDDLRAPAFVAELRALGPDVIVVVAFRILPPEVYQTARLGAFNLHASLLPAYRGAAPIQRALMAGERETGVTTFLLQPSVDTGAILRQERLSVGPDETGGELHDRLAALGAALVVETAQGLLAGTLRATPQDDTRASRAPKIFRDDARLDWARAARALHNHVRALAPVPGAWTAWRGETLKVLATQVAQEDGRCGTPGAVLEAGPRLVVACGEGALELRAVQREGKRRVEAAAFLNGAGLRPGEHLGEHLGVLAGERGATP